MLTSPGPHVVNIWQGEILVRGPQVMQGYLNAPQKTAETLIADGWVSGTVVRGQR